MGPVAAVYPSGSPLALAAWRFNIGALALAAAASVSRRGWSRWRWSEVPTAACGARLLGFASVACQVGDHRRVIFSGVCMLARCLLGCLMVVARREVSKDAGLLVLRHENAVPADRPVRYQPGDRLWLVALSRLIARHRRGEVLAMTPATLLAWHRRLVARQCDYASRRRPGRPCTAAAIRTLVIRIATDNPTRRHRRVHGELIRLGHRMAASAVWQILHDAGINPAPRRNCPTWKQFLTAQAGGILARESAASGSATGWLVPNASVWPGVSMPSPAQPRPPGSPGSGCGVPCAQRSPDGP